MKPILLACCTLLLAGFISRKPKLRLPDEFVRVPAGSVSMPAEPGSDGARGDSFVITSMRGFYISAFEVTNRQYRDFIDQSSLTGSDLARILPDTSGWRKVSAEPMVKHYFRHPSFSEYPVVNVSHDAALSYCKWLQDKIQKNNPEFNIEVRLPAKYEWVYAAQGGRLHALFPWANYYLRNKRGEPMCNFKEVRDGSIYRNRITGKPEVVVSPATPAKFTSTVKSFSPNDYGIFNMCGNAAEMIAQPGIAMGGSWNDYGGDVHILAQQNTTEPSPTVGFRPVIIVTER